MAIRPPAAIEVRIWNKRVGAVAFDPSAGTYAFEYAPAWRKLGIELAPLMMPVAGARAPFVFPSLNRDSFKGLPGLLADALPDDFGNNLVDAWMAQQGVAKRDITTLDRLAYMGKRGMGALEFHPARHSMRDTKLALDLGQLVEVARNVVHGNLDGDAHAHEALANIIRVGTSAGGARAKAVVAWNPQTHELRSGQFDVPEGFEHWLLKFDGVGKDDELGASQSYGRIEYAYYLMAHAAGIEMSECRLLEENGRHHFMTRRWDRDGNTKHHVQSLCGIYHLDYKQRATHAYEQLFQVIDLLGLPQAAKQQAYLRMAFNVMAANCDDHTKNHAFVLRQGDAWQLAPAYDITHAHNPKGEWTYQHLMSVNGKFLEITRDDLLLVADRGGVSGARGLLADVRTAVDAWAEHAATAGLGEQDAANVAKDLKAL
jgi:serine/threonine-protein kinase HipA